MFERYAIYVTFEGALADAGAAWLGWDIARGAAIAHPDLQDFDLAQITARPRKYGFHATIKAPFYLAENTSQHDLQSAFEKLCATTPPAKADGLKIHQMGRMFALVPEGNDADIKALAAQVVRSLNPMRAPLTPEDTQRRQKRHLSDQQHENLSNWGYPFVMDDFRFHVTLTGALKEGEQSHIKIAADGHFTPLLPRPFAITHLTLVGARADGLFQQISRTALTG